MRSIFPVFLVLCLLIISGCKPAPDCEDPLGCAHFEREQLIQIGIVTPRTDPHACPTAAEAAAAVRAVLAETTISNRPISVIEEDSLNDPVVAQQRLNDLAEDPTTVGLFYLDCSPDPVRAAQTAANAGIPGFVHQLPEKTEGIYSILPPVEVQADHLVWLLDMEVEDNTLLVVVDPLDGPETLSNQICDRWRESRGSCSVETFSEELMLSPVQAETLLVLSSRADSLAGSDEVTSSFSTIYWFDPMFSQPPGALSRPKNVSLSGSPPKYQSTWFAVQAADALVEAVQNASFEKHGRLYLPRTVVLAELDRLIFPDCQGEDDPACPTSFDYTTYPFRDGILIINP